MKKNNEWLLDSQFGPVNISGQTQVKSSCFPPWQVPPFWHVKSEQASQSRSFGQSFGFDLSLPQLE